MHPGHFPGRLRVTGRRAAASCRWTQEMNQKRIRSRNRLCQHGHRLPASVEEMSDGQCGARYAAPARNALSRQTRRGDGVLRFRVLRRRELSSCQKWEDDTPRRPREWTIQEEPHFCACWVHAPPVSGFTVQLLTGDVIDPPLG